MIPRSLHREVPGLNRPGPALISSVCCILLSLSCLLPLPSQAAAGKNKECVLILHGLGRTARSMKKLAAALQGQGYQTVNLDYPSTQKNIDQIVEEDFAQGLAACQADTPSKIHFVSHSLGGIIIRQALNRRRPANLGRVVMLSPPNQGSEITDSLKDEFWYHWIFGPAGQQLGTDAQSIPNLLGPVDYPVGIITGDRYALFDFWFSELVAGKDDGKVSIQRARLNGMTDFLVVHQSHPFIMKSDFVIEETIHFLTNGRFRHQLAPPPPTGPALWFSRDSQ